MKKLLKDSFNEYREKLSKVIKLQIQHSEVQRRLNDEEYNKQCPEWNKRLRLKSKYGYLYDRYITENGDVWIVDYDGSIMENLPNFTFPDLKRILGYDPPEPDLVLILFDLMDGEVHEISNDDVDNYLGNIRYHVYEALKY